MSLTINGKYEKTTTEKGGNRMGQRFIAFDVETPNSANDRMSAIGVTVVENGRIVEEFYALVDPETWFDPFNVALTGITPEMTAGQPTFPELWKGLRPVMDSGLLSAHNAPFDLSVLAKCLRAYGIRWRPSVEYVCTVQMGRRVLPELPNHKLDTLCGFFGLDLDHHHAGSDSRACAGLLLRYLQRGAELEPFLRTYDLEGIRTVRRRPARREEGDAGFSGSPREENGRGRAMFLDWDGNGRIDPVDVGISLAAEHAADAEEEETDAGAEEAAAGEKKARPKGRKRFPFPFRKSRSAPAETGSGGPGRIALIGCTKKKRTVPCPARELYSPSRLFALSYQYAKAHADAVYILSAKYGLLPEDVMAAPYDLTLNTMSKAERVQWADRVFAQLREACRIEETEFILLAGKRYYEYLLPRLPAVSLPLEHLAMGERMAWLKAALDEEEGAPRQSAPPRPAAGKPAPRPAGGDLPLSLAVGDRVRHDVFGEGEVISVTPMGGDALVVVAFAAHETKKLMLRFASRFMEKLS